MTSKYYHPKGSSNPSATKKKIKKIMKTIHFILFAALTGGTTVWAQSSLGLMPIVPESDEIVTTPYPNFVWTPAVGSMGSVTYDFRVVEVYSHQSAESAIQSNPAIYVEREIALSSFLYPAMAPYLEVGKTYAWQVSAAGWDGAGEGFGAFRQISPPALFTVKADPTIQVCTILPDEGDSKRQDFYLLDHKVLRFALPEGLTVEDLLDFDLVNHRGESVTGKKRVKPRWVEEGEYFELLLGQFKAFSGSKNKMKLHSLVIRTLEEQTYELRFMIKR